MAIKKSQYMTGEKQVPSITEPGELYEVTIVLDTAVTNLLAGDIVQLMQVPAGGVISDIKIGASATLGLTTVAAGIATNSTAATLAKTYIAAATLPNTVARYANATVMEDTALDAPTVDERIVALVIAAQAESVNKIYAAIQYRAKG